MKYNYSMDFSTLQDLLQEQLSRLPGDVALSVKFLDSEEIFEHNSNLKFWAASVIKIPICLTVYKQIQEGTLDPEKRYKIAGNNKVDGSGISKLFSPDTEFTLRDLVVMAITISDNSASNQLVDIVGGANVIEDYILKIGMTSTTHRHKMMIKAGKGPNLITAQDISFLLEKMYKNKLPGSGELLEIMKHTRLRDRIVDLLPNSVLVSHKPGSLPEAVHEVGVIYSQKPFTFCFFSDEQKDKRQAKRALSTCAKLCYEYSEKFQN